MGGNDQHTLHDLSESLDTFIREEDIFRAVGESIGDQLIWEVMQDSLLHCKLELKSSIVSPSKKLPSKFSFH